MNRTGIAVTAALVACAAPRASADQIALESLRDNTLYESTVGDLSNGAGTGFFAGITNMAQRRRGLVAFEIAASIPAGSTITAVTLTLNMSQTIAGPQMVDLHRVLADWGEGTSVAPGMGGFGGPATSGDATWLHTFYDTDFWATEGGDFAEAASAGLIVDQIGFYSWSSANMVADVQAWLDDPSIDFGWLLMGNEAGFGTTKRFDTHEHADPDLRPTLLVEYTPVPGPGGLAVLAMVLLRPGARRRRARHLLWYDPPNSIRRV